MFKTRQKMFAAFLAALICGLLGFVCSCVSVNEKSGYILKFKSNGKNYEVVNVLEGAEVTMPEAPERKGYTFDGWFFDENVWNNPVGDNFKIEKNTTVYAKWSLVTYKITYKGPSDEVLDIEGFGLPDTYTVESPDIELHGYYISGYRFVNWSKDNMVVGYIPSGSAGDLVLYGKFISEAAYSINYVDELFGRKNEANPDYYELGDGEIELQPLAEKIDYNFVGWSNGFDIVETIDTSLGGDITLYTVWEQKAELKNLTYVVDDDYIEYNPLGFIMITGVTSYITQEIVVPDYVSMIAPGAFGDCMSVKNLTIPFMGATANDTTENAYLGYIFGGVGLTGNKKVPSSLENLTVTGGDVRDYAFKDCANLKKITFEEGVKSIGGGAMENCNSLVEVTLPFIGQRYDESVEYNGTKYEGRPDSSNLDYVFGNSIPKSLKKIAITKGFVTEDCAGSALSGLSYDCNVEELDYTSVNETIYERMFIALPGSVTRLTIRGNVTKIGKNIFYANSSVANIVLPDTVTEIGESAFTGAPELKEISVPNVTSIGANAFNGCSALTKVETGNDLVSIGEGAFKDCAKLAQFDAAGSKLVTIGKDAFANCTELFRFTLPETVTSLGDGAFTNCTGLIEVRNLSSLTATKGGDELGGLCKYAWDVYTTASEQSKISDTDGYLVYKQSDGDIFIRYIGSSKNIEIPAGVKTIRKSAFYGNETIEEVVIPASVEAIETDAFRGCTGLKTVRIADGVVEFGQDVFNGCTSLTTVVLPNNLQKISAGLFDGCSSLTEIALPSGVTEIGERAFKDTNLAQITLADGITKISDSAFMGAKLVSITLSAGITEIGESAFEDCTELTTVVIPANSMLRIIGKYAFAYCRNLETITLPEGLTTIGTGAFYHKNSGSKLESINLPSSLTTLGDQAFAYTALRAIEIPESITVIKEYTFVECHSLTDVKLPSNLTEIGECAFRDCVKLVSIDIPESLRIIRKGAFAYCNELTALALPNVMTTIESGILQMSNKLKSLAVPFIGSSLDSEESNVTYSHFFLGGSGIFGGVPDSLKNLSVYGGKILRYSFWPKYSATGSAIDNANGSLTSLTLGEGVTSIAYGALESLTALKSLVLPYAGVTSAAEVGQANQTLEYLFNQRLFNRTTTWKNLETIGVLSGEIPEAFYNNYNNENVTNKFKKLILGKDVTKVSLKIFNIRAASVYYMGTEAEWNSITFENNLELEKYATHYYYSATDPFTGSGAVTSGNYWHYGTTMTETLIWEVPTV